MSAEIWSTIDACVATRMANPDDVTILTERLGASNHERQWRKLIGELAVGEAVILSHSDHPSDTPTVFRLAERLSCLRRREAHAPRRRA